MLTKKKKLTKKQLSRIKLWWEIARLIDAEYWDKIMLIEKRMKLDPVIGIKDIEFFWKDGLAGIGNASRTIELIHSTTLEK